MALIKCKVCGGKVSENATACPHCGEPMKPSGHPGSEPEDDGYQPEPPKRNRGCIWTVVFLLIVAGMVLGGIIYRDRQAREEALAQARAERLQHEQDSLAHVARELAVRDSIWRNMSTPDLRLFDLHGNVKQVVYSMDDEHGLIGIPMYHGRNGNRLTTFNFDHEGTWTNVPGKPMRNGGQLVSYTNGGNPLGDDDSGALYKLRWKEGRPASGTAEYWEGGENYVFNYNADGYLTGYAYESGGEGQMTKGTVAYSIQDSDSIGNWTVLKCRDSFTTSYDGDEDESGTSTWLISRRITYHHK